MALKGGGDVRAWIVEDLYSLLLSKKGFKSSLLIHNL